MKSDISFPETVEIAVFISCNGCLALCESKYGDWLLAGLKVLLLIPLAGLKENEGDIVCRKHRMLHGPDGNGHGVPVHLDDRDMLFPGGVRRVGDEFLLVVAEVLKGLVMNGDVAAGFAFVKIHKFSSGSDDAAFPDNGRKLCVSCQNRAVGKAGVFIGNDIAQLRVFTDGDAAHDDGILYFRAGTDAAAGEYDAVFNLAFDDAVVGYKAVLGRNARRNRC